MANLASNFDPAYSVPGMGSPYEISGLLSIPKPTVATISNYLSLEDTTIKPNSILNNLPRVKLRVNKETGNVL